MGCYKNPQKGTARNEKTYGDFMFNILTMPNPNKLGILQMTESKEAALKGILFIKPYNF